MAVLHIISVGLSLLLLGLGNGGVHGVCIMAVDGADDVPAIGGQSAGRCCQ
jgi:hypothetical protein